VILVFSTPVELVRIQQNKIQIITEKNEDTICIILETQQMMVELGLSLNVLSFKLLSLAVNRQLSSSQDSFSITFSQRLDHDSRLIFDVSRLSRVSQDWKGKWALEQRSDNRKEEQRKSSNWGSLAKIVIHYLFLLHLSRLYSCQTIIIQILFLAAVAHVSEFFKLNHSCSPAAMNGPLARNCRWTLLTQLTDRF